MEQQLTPVEMPEKPVLTTEEQTQVEVYKSRINLEDKSNIIRYGAESQHKMVSFSETVLSQLRNKDIGAVGDLLSGLVADLKSFDRSINETGLRKLFSSLKRRVAKLKADYSRIEKNVCQVELQLEKHYQTLSKDIHLFETLYARNEQYYRELTLYIYAAEEKLAEVRDEVIPALKREAAESGNPQLEQRCQYLEQQLIQLEKKIGDLKISRMISLQLAPQIRLVQNNSATLMDRIHSSMVNTLPLWRNQMVLALGLVHSQQALDAQRAVNDATNQMLARNSEMLKSTSVEIARENERSVVDMETLHKVNADLFETIESVLAVQEEGRRKRKETEQELLRVETDLKKKLASL